MEKRYDKGQIETVVLQAVLARPYKEFGRLPDISASCRGGRGRRQKSCGQP